MTGWLKDLVFALLIFGISATVIISIAVISEITKPTTPVEEMYKVKSLTATNDSIKLVINELDSVKHAKIIEVQTLNTDSTVKLFYELVKE